MRARLLPRSFYARDVVEVARDLVGHMIGKDRILLRITEVEAYAGPEDSASHARFGLTRRNSPMWGPPGRAYVYLCYGIHNMLNVVTGDEGRGSAILIRACEPVRGLALVRERRGGKDGPVLLTGPGRVAEALAVDPSWSHHPLYEPGGLTVLEGARPDGILAGPRVGVDYASPEDRSRPWRFAAAGSAWVTDRRGLQFLPTKG